jgi:DNA polymerase-3 subunit delta'
MHAWHKTLRERLLQDPARLPHALLLSGPPGIGKQSFAMTLAHALLCATPGPDGEPCGQCQGCHWFAQATHPDFQRIEPEVDEETGKQRPEIRIEQVRNLVDFFALTAHQRGWRIAVIAPAERLNTAAANGLLKTLEEPPPRSLLLLISDHPRRLPATVRSRCQQVAMPIPARSEALDWLVTQRVPVDQAAALLDEAGGAPLAALALHGDTVRGERRARCLTALVGLRPEALLDLAAGKDQLVETHGWLRRWLHDLISQSLAGQVHFFATHREDLQRLAARADLARLLALQAQLDNAAHSLTHPLNATLVMEGWFIAYMDCFLMPS